MILASDILAGRIGKPVTLGTLANDLRLASAKRRAYRMTVRQLRSLDDTTLTAMGLNRSRIRQHAHHKIYPVQD